MKYIDFNDESIPVGKRKVAFVKWAMSKGTEKIEAQRIANKKFGKTPRMITCIVCNTKFDDSYYKCPNCGE